MAEGQGREQWAHTSTVLAMIANVNRDPKKGRALKPDDFNPYADERRSNAIPVSDAKDAARVLRAAFGGRRKRKKRGKGSK